MTKLTGSLGVRSEINVDIIGTGARGKEGKSAYEIWLDLGNEGTEQEYLASLKGQDGDTPVKGVDYFDGAQGPKGDKGDAATVSVGAVTTGEAGTDASVENVGTSSAAVFNFVIPRGDKGERGEQGIPGPQGEPGSDADVTAENIQSALGYAPAKPDGVYELIETITLTEAVNVVKRTTEPDGTLYNFVAINSIVEFAIGAGNGQVYFVCMNGSKEIMVIERPNCITPSSKRYVQGKYELIHGAWFSQLLSPNNGMLANSTAFTNPMSQGGFFASDYPAITAFKLASATSEVPIPAGTIISIYGVRA